MVGTTFLAQGTVAPMPSVGLYVIDRICTKPMRPFRT